MSEIIHYNIEGTDSSIITFRDGTTHQLPLPNGEGKEGLRQYSFIKDVMDSYKSDGNKKIEVGVTYQFIGVQNFLMFSKEDLHYLFKAKNDSYVNVVLSSDKPAINFDVRIDFTYNYVKGIVGHHKGYTVALTMEGVDFLDQSGYEGLTSSGSFGTGYGEGVGGTPY